MEPLTYEIFTVCRFLDAQLRRNDCTGHGLRERLHDRRSTMDSILAHLLGHHECFDKLLRDRLGAKVLLLGIRMAVAQ